MRVEYIVRRRRIRQGVDGGRGVCVPGDAEWALVAAGSVIGKMQTWALLSLTPFKQRRLDLQCGGAHPPACHSHTHTRTDIPGESVAQLINFRSVTCVVVVALSLSLARPSRIYICCLRAWKSAFSLWCIHTLAALRTRGRAQNPETRRSPSLSPVRFCACLAYPLGWLMSTGFLLSQRLLQTTSRAAEYLFGATVTQRDFFLSAFCVLVLFGSLFCTFKLDFAARWSALSFWPK
jgi:hypothetical protein